MPRVVTDPALIAQLEAVPEKGKVVTDPALLEALNARSSQMMGNMRAQAKPPPPTPLEPDVDYRTGVQDLGTRYSLNAADTDLEREAVLNRKFGQQNWRRDSEGRIIVSPQGMQAIGQPSQKEVALDELGLSWGDLADIGPDVPPILGGVIGGVMTGGMGAIPAMLAGGALGSMGGRAIQETGESLAGQNLQGPAGVAGELATSGAEGLAGEGIYRGLLRPMGRVLAGHPAGRSKIRDEPWRKDAMDQALEMGVRPKPSQVSGNWLLARAEGMLKSIFGDVNEEANSRALVGRMERMKTAAGPETLPSELGGLIKRDIDTAHKAFKTAASTLYRKVDQLAGDQPIVSTSGIKARAAELLEEMPKTADGKPVFVNEGVVSALRDAAALPDQMTVSQANAMRTHLRDMWQTPSLTQEVPEAQARELWKAIGRDIDELKTGNMQVDQALKAARGFYREGIAKFDDHFISQIARDPRLAGSVDPEHIVQAAFKPNSPTRAQKLMRVLPEETKAKVRRSAMNKMLDDLAKVEDPANMFKDLFSGSKLKKDGLDKYGVETLDAVFGRQQRADLYKLANVLRLLETNKGLSSGIVAANLALHPLKNLGKLTQLRIYANILASGPGLKYMTTGIRAPKTRAGIDALARLTNMTAQMVDEETMPENRAREVGAQ